MHLRRSFYGTSVLLLLALALLTGCSGGASTTSVAVAPAPTATATPTCTVAPATWKVYRGLHFTICYPPGWWYRIDRSTPEKKLILVSSLVVGPTGTEVTNEINIEESLIGDARISNYCRTDPSMVEVSLAGATWRYTNGEGVYRTWNFINASHYFYGIIIMDGNQSQANQAADDAVLATLRLDDTTPGCPKSA